MSRDHHKSTERKLANDLNEDENKFIEKITLDEIDLDIIYEPNNLERRKITKTYTFPDLTTYRFVYYRIGETAKYNPPDFDLNSKFKKHFRKIENVVREQYLNERKHLRRRERQEQKAAEANNDAYDDENGDRKYHCGIVNVEEELKAFKPTIKRRTSPKPKTDKLVDNEKKVKIEDVTDHNSNVIRFDDPMCVKTETGNIVNYAYTIPPRIKPRIIYELDSNEETLKDTNKESDKDQKSE